jgi:hypothetical protein
LPTSPEVSLAGVGHDGLPALRMQEVRPRRHSRTESSRSRSWCRVWGPDRKRRGVDSRCSRTSATTRLSLAMTGTAAGGAGSGLGQHRRVPSPIHDDARARSQPRPHEPCSEGLAAEPPEAGACAVPDGSDAKPRMRPHARSGEEECHGLPRLGSALGLLPQEALRRRRRGCRR